MDDLLVPVIVVAAVCFLALRILKATRSARREAGSACADDCGCSPNPRQRPAD